MTAMRYRIKTPAPKFTGTIARVDFTDGVAVVNESDEGVVGALAYFRRRDYDVQPEYSDSGEQQSAESGPDGGETADGAGDGQKPAADEPDNADNAAEPASAAAAEATPDTGQEPAAAERKRPAKNASREDLVTYAVEAVHIPAESLNGKNKADINALIDEQEHKLADGS